MPKPNPDAPFLIEDYIASKADFARPLLTELHRLILSSHSELTEDWKWSAPAFTLGGKIICVLWGFKKHVSVTFSRGDELDDWAKAFLDVKRTQHSRRFFFTAGAQVDAKCVIDYVQQACAIEEAELGNHQAKPKKKKNAIRVVVPSILKEALAADKKAKDFFDQLPPGYRRDYCRWISEAKREDTRQRRLSKTLEGLRSGRKTLFY